MSRVDSNSEGRPPAAAPPREPGLHDGVPVPVLVYDVDSLRFLSVNQAALDAYGYSRAEFLALKITDIRPLEDVPRLLRNFEMFSQPVVKHGVWKHVRKDGAVMDMEIVSQDASEPGRRARLIVATDVSERRRADAADSELKAVFDRALPGVRDLVGRRRLEQAMRESDQRLRAAFQIIPDALNIGRLEDGVNIAVNEGFCRLTGYNESEVVNVSTLSLGMWADPEQRVRLFTELRATGAIRAAEVRFRAKDGAEFIGLLSSQIFDVDERHPDPLPVQRAGREQPAEPAADDDHPRPGFGRACGSLWAGSGLHVRPPC